MKKKENKKILFILPNLNAGGAERVTINYLRALDLDKYKVILAVFDQTNELLDLVPEKVTLVNLNTKKTMFSFFALLKLFRSFKPDVVYSTHSRVSALLFFVRPLVSDIKYIARMQSTPSLERQNREYGSIKRWLYAIGFRNADIVIAQTKEMGEDAIDVFGIDSESICVLNNPLDTVYIQNSLNNSDSPFSKDEISAVISGRLSKEKGFDVIIKALPYVVSRHKNFILHILGSDGGEMTNLKDFVKELSLEKNVVFHGFVNNPYRFYGHCDMFILPSRREGLPNAMLENYYLNTPIVATKCVPVVEQFIKEGVNGFICEVNDVDCLAKKTIKCIELKRGMIINDDYISSSLEEIL
jgi:glycosyltransferase involved in cell wall biosynthesis